MLDINQYFLHGVAMATVVGVCPATVWVSGLSPQSVLGQGTSSFLLVVVVRGGKGSCDIMCE